MRRILIFAIASVLSAACFAAPSNLATQEWVKKALANVGVRVSTATVETNTTTSATGSVVTNLTFSSPYTCAEVPQCRAISFTVSPAKRAYRQATTAKTKGLLELLFRTAYGDEEYDTTIEMTIQSGYWTDKAGNVHMFLFDGGWTVELLTDELPHPPFGTHVCTEFDSECVCKNYGKTAADFADDAEYQNYADVSASEFYKEYGNFEQWVDTSLWGMYEWQEKRTGPKGTTYYIIDDTGFKFDIEKIFSESDAIIEAMASAVFEVNQYLKACREKYVALNTCKNGTPQHQWKESSCGRCTWRKCSRNASHTEGTEQHSYPGAKRTLSAHWCICESQSELHEWTEWKVVSTTVEYVTYERHCTVCSISEEEKRPNEFSSCVKELDVHVPNKDDSVCGCECGEYSNEKQSTDERLHKWSTTEKNSDGVLKCRCFCGYLHEFREGGKCPEACAYCLVINMKGGKATEEYHIKKDATERRCGCKCGLYGVSAGHEGTDLYADTYRLHVKCATTEDGTDTSPAYCQCYGASGNGGKWHWHTPRSDGACPQICAYVKAGDKLGHLVSADESKPVYGFTEANASHHSPATSGCGCACGGCNDDNAALWKDEKKLHKPSVNATDKCHCKCGAHLVGDGVDGHAFVDGACICTCGERHSGNLDSCGYCTVCERYWKNGAEVEVAKVEHWFDDGACTCSCPAKKENPDPFKHDFNSGHKCTCGKYHTTEGISFGCGYCSKCHLYLADDGSIIDDTEVDHDFPRDENGVRKCTCDCQQIHNDDKIGGCGKCSYCKKFRDESGNLVDELPEANHEFVAYGYCSCKCGEYHKLNGSPACRLCRYCGRIDEGYSDNGVWVMADPAKAENHLFPAEKCTCGCGQHPNPKGHYIPSNACRCECTEVTIPHIPEKEVLAKSESFCSNCGAKFIGEAVILRCSRCAEIIESNASVSIGEHFPSCGTETPPPRCYSCGCYCSAGSHAACGSGIKQHVCLACCYTLPPEPGVDPDNPIGEQCSVCGRVNGHEIWCPSSTGCPHCGSTTGHWAWCPLCDPEDPENPDPDNPDPDNPEPQPPSCDHDFQNDSWEKKVICPNCGAVRTASGARSVCRLCGMIVDGWSKSEGCTCTPNTPDDENEEPIICGAELVGGGTCGAEFYASFQGCPNERNHKSYHSGGGGGASGGGSLNDIIGPTLPTE